MRIINHSQDMKQPASTGGQTDEEGVVHVHTGILVGHKKEGNPAICDSMIES